MKFNGNKNFCVNRMIFFIFIFLFLFESSKILCANTKTKQIPLQLIDDVPKENEEKNLIEASTSTSTNQEDTPRFSQTTTEGDANSTTEVKNEILTNSMVYNKKPPSSAEESETEVFAAQATAGTTYKWGYLFWNFMEYPPTNCLSGHTGWWQSKSNVQTDHWEAIFNTLQKIDVIFIKWKNPPKRFKIYFKIDDSFDWIPATEVHEKASYVTYEGKRSAADAVSYTNAAVFGKPFFAKRIRITLSQPLKKGSFAISEVRFYEKRNTVIIKNEMLDPCKNYCYYVNTDKPRENVLIEAYPCIEAIAMGNNNELFIQSSDKSVRHQNSKMCIGFNKAEELVLRKCEDYGSAYTIGMRGDLTAFFDGYSDKCIYIEDKLRMSPNFVSESTEVITTSEADPSNFKKENIRNDGENYWHSALGEEKVTIQILFGKLPDGTYESKKVDTIKIEWVREPDKFMLYTWSPGETWQLRHSYTKYNKKVSNINLVGVEASGIMLILEKSRKHQDLGGLPGYAMKSIYVGYNAMKLKMIECKARGDKYKIFDFEPQRYKKFEKTAPAKKAQKNVTQIYEKAVALYKKLQNNMQYIITAKERATAFDSKYGEASNIASSTVKKLMDFATKSLPNIPNAMFENMLRTKKEHAFLSTIRRQNTASSGLGTIEYPAQDCLQIKRLSVKAMSGIYYIKPECSHKALRVFCDFVSYGDAVDIYVFNDDANSPNPDLGYLGIRNHIDVRYQCAKLGLQAIRLYNKEMVDRIYQILIASGYHLTKPQVVPLGYDYTCIDGQCTGMINSIHDIDSPPIMQFFTKLRKPGTFTKPGPMAGLGYSHQPSLITFDPKVTTITALICSTNHFITDSTDTGEKTISCAMDVSANGGIFPIGADILVKCPPKCGNEIGKVYGSGLYQEKSSICGAGLHSGELPPQGGKMYVRVKRGLLNYQGILSNGIKSLDYSINDGGRGFTVRKYIPVCPINRFADREKTGDTSFIEDEVKEKEVHNSEFENNANMNRFIDGSAIDDTTHGLNGLLLGMTMAAEKARNDANTVAVMNALSQGADLSVGTAALLKARDLQNFKVSPIGQALSRISEPVRRGINDGFNLPYWDPDRKEKRLQIGFDPRYGPDPRYKIPGMTNHPPPNFSSSQSQSDVPAMPSNPITSPSTLSAIKKKFGIGKDEGTPLPSPPPEPRAAPPPEGPNAEAPWQIIDPPESGQEPQTGPATNLQCSPTTEDSIKTLTNIRETGSYESLEQMRIKGKKICDGVKTFTKQLAWSEGASKLSVDTMSKTFHRLSAKKIRVFRSISLLSAEAMSRVQRTEGLRKKWEKKLENLESTDPFALDYSIDNEKIFSKVFSIFDIKGRIRSNWEVYRSGIKGRSKSFGVTSKVYSKKELGASILSIKKAQWFDLTLNVDILFRSGSIAGVAFRMSDNFNYYAFVINKEEGFKALAKVVNGKTEYMKKIYDGGILLNQWHSVTITANAGKLKVNIYDKETTDKSSSEKTLEVIDYTFIRGTVGIFVNNMEGFFFDSLAVNPESCWTPWAPKKNLEVTNVNSSAHVEDFRGTLETKFSIIDPPEENGGPSLWLMNAENKIGDTIGISQKSLIFDNSPLKRSSILIYNNLSFTNGSFSISFFAQNGNGIVSVIFKYAKEKNTTGEETEVFFSFDSVNNGKTGMFTLRKFFDGAMKELKSITTNVKGLPRLGYEPRRKTMVEVMCINERISISVSINGSAMTNVINVDDPSINSGSVGVGTYRAKVDVTYMEIMPPKLAFTEADKSFILTNDLSYIPFPDVVAVKEANKELEVSQGARDPLQDAYGIIKGQCNAVGSVMGKRFKVPSNNARIQQGSVTESPVSQVAGTVTQVAGTVTQVSGTDNQVLATPPQKLHAGWKVCTASSTSDRNAYCNTIHPELKREQCKADFCTECCKANISNEKHNVIHLCQKTCSKAALVETVNDDYESVCFNTNTPTQSIYTYCEKKMNDYDKTIMRYCKLDMCNLCCSTLDQIKHKNYAFKNLQMCFKKCSDRYNTKREETKKN